jgi:colanic acid/amylovoran biosynthesis glycosyltransferase
MPEPMNIAYLTSAYARASDSFIRGEVVQLRAMGHAVHTFSIRRLRESGDCGEQVRQEQAGTTYITEAGAPGLLRSALGEAARSSSKMASALRLATDTAWPGIKGRLWPIAYWLEAAYLARELRARAVQHLHNHLGQGSATVAMLAAHLAGIPYSLTIHGPNEFDDAPKLSLDVKIARAAFVVAISRHGRGQLMRWCNAADWSKIQVVRCGVDPSFLAGASPIPPNSKTLICVGRLSEEKGHLFLLQAAKVLAETNLDFRIAIIGDGPCRGLLESQIRAMNLNSRVQLLGNFSAAEVRRAILESRAMVLPSLAEGLPVVLMESLALQRPVIATRIAGIPELVEHDTNGWLIPAGSVEALAGAMRQALQIPINQLQQMGRAGATKVADEHDLRTQSRKLDMLFAHAIAHAPQPAQYAPHPFDTDDASDEPDLPVQSFP